MNVTMRKALVASFVVAGAFAATSFAQGGPGYGPGMMGGGSGYGPGMMGDGPGRGYGPGGGCGPGGGYGRGGGYGPGAMLESLNLSGEQRAKVEAVREENRQKNWTAMGQIRADMYKLRSLYSADKVDANAVAEQQKKVDELRLQMLKSHIESQNRIEALLTPDQRKQFRQLRPRWMQEG